MQGFGFYKSHMLNTLHDDEPGASGNGATPPQQPPAKDPPKTDDDEGDATVSMKQADLDKLISKRLEKSRKSWEKELEEKKQKDGLSETEKLKAEKEAAEKRALEKETAANQRIIKADLKAEAISQGVSKESLEYFLKVVDSEDIELDDNGNPDATAITKAVAAALKAVPQFKGNAQKDLGGGSNPGNAQLPDEMSDLQTKLKAAKDAGNVVTAVRLERQIHELSQKK